MTKPRFLGRILANLKWNPPGQDPAEYETPAENPAQTPAQEASPPASRPKSWLDRCPVCSTLPLGNLDIVGEAPSLEYAIDLDPLQLEALERWYLKCNLVRLVCNLAKYWTSKYDDQDLEQAMTTDPCRYVNTCKARDERWLYTQVEFGNFLSAYLYHIVVPPDTLSPDAVRHFRHWVNTCNNDHEHCNFSSNTKLPTRVLDVHDLRSIKLHCSGSKLGRYIALSHCWGASRPFITTHSSFEEMKNGFDVESAPKTFQDAILVTRSLDCRYLWIDSLCIIQDDGEDWIIESAKLSDVYAHAYLTISATNSDDDAKGFLCPRPSKYSSLRITSSIPGKSAQVYLQYDRDAPNMIGGRMTKHRPLDAR